MDELLSMGMSDAKQVSILVSILVGRDHAGGNEKMKQLVPGICLFTCFQPSFVRACGSDEGGQGEEDITKIQTSTIIATMSSVGVFHKVVMDEKSYWTYSLTQTVNPTSSDGALAMNSGGEDLPPEPLFFCPSARILFLKLRWDGDYYDRVVHPFNSSPHFPISRRINQQGESLLDCDDEDICKLPVVPLCWCNNKGTDRIDFSCGACEQSMVSAGYYVCLECEKEFHKECVESPLEIRHPSHPFHSFQLDYHEMCAQCICCDTTVTSMFYHCTTCDVAMHPTCAMVTVPIVIDHLKSHPHPLNLFPRQATLACNICGLIQNRNPTYVCTQCVFVAHKNCIGFPHVIRISRHHHRVSFTFSIPPGKWSCGVCRQLVDDNFGAYSCNKCDAYFVHSKCALRKEVWDGKELDGVLEEEDVIDDGEPFERISDGIILHFSHSHNMRLEISKVYDENQLCEGCGLPIYEGKYYSCTEECRYILHESCAYASRMKRHPLYPHPLKLYVDTHTNDYTFHKGLFSCSVCMRESNGFVYEHRTEGTVVFQLDLRCALVTEPFEHQSHKHPLYLALDQSKVARCQICRFSGCSRFNCIECDYIICFRCVTLPYRVSYKHDSHFLTMCYEKEATDQPDWCECCEGKINEEEGGGFRNIDKKLFYKCNDCCTTLHARCLLGIDIYMRPGIFHKFSSPTSENVWDWVEYQILRNSSQSRPVCNGCKGRCSFPVVFKSYKYNMTFCCLNCI